MFSSRIDAALELAAIRHRKQRRKGTQVPYFVHPVHVAMIVQRAGGSEDAIIIGILHDVVEDTCRDNHERVALLGALEAKFGAHVRHGVAALSEPKHGPDGEKLLWEQRKDVYLSQLEAAAEDAILAATADKLHNLSTLLEALSIEGLTVFDRFSRGPDETLGYYERVTAIINRRAPAATLTKTLGELVSRFREQLRARATE